MSARHRGRLGGAPVTNQTAAPAGGVRLQTFVRWQLVQRGVQRAVITPNGTPAVDPVPAPDADAARATPLQRALGLAHHWQRLIAEGRVTSVAALAATEGLDSSQVHRLMRLALLAPNVVERLLSMPDLPVERVLGRPWPYGWADQAKVVELLI